MGSYDDLLKAFKEAGLEGRIIQLPEERIPTPEDFAKLEHSITMKLEENNGRLVLSEIYAELFSLPTDQ